MAVKHGVVTVGNTPTALVGAETDLKAGQSGVWTNTGAQTVFVGDSTVTAAAGASQGYPVAVGASVRATDLAPGEVLFGIVATGTSSMAFLKTGV